jgi:hypothetical protein
MRTVQWVGEVLGRHKFWIAAFLMAALPACVEKGKDGSLLLSLFR